MEIRPLAELKEWERNKELRLIDADDFDRLKENLKYGQHSTLLIRPDGTVIGGNHRMKAMKEMNYITAKCQVVDFGQDTDGFYPIIDGEIYRDHEGNIPYHFQSIEDGELTLALSHNSNPAYYNRDGIANAMGNHEAIDWRLFDGDLIDPVNFEEREDMIKGVGRAKKEETESKKKEPKITTCPNCQTQFTKINGETKIVSLLDDTALV